MGKTKGSYNPEFPKGTRVQVVSCEALAAFMREWRFHNPLEPAQLNYAGHIAAVQEVGFYHGGDELYQLEDIPGAWHEACLEQLAGVA